MKNGKIYQKIVTAVLKSSGANCILFCIYEYLRELHCDCDEHCFLRDKGL